ncbi:putative reverse transcriptase domain-containing protein [Tanacetum coccineum]
MSVHDYLKRYVWNLDSGCYRHMTGVKQYLHRYSKESGPKVVFGDNSSGDTEGYGSMNCNGITFTKVAYVNGLKHNLININQLCDANFKVLFTKTQGTIFNQNNEVVLIALRRRDVYVIDMSSYNEESNACFFAKMENLNEVRVKELRSDNGTEFRNNKLEEFCNKKGISQTFSSSCTPEQNGLAKRRNKTLIEVARTKLNSANLLKRFWGEAVNSACYTPNRSIIIKIHGKTTYDVLRGRSPDISYFYVFGCPVHIHNHRDHLGKLDEKADDGFYNTSCFQVAFGRIRDAFSVCDLHYRFTHSRFCHVGFRGFDDYLHGEDPYAYMEATLQAPPLPDYVPGPEEPEHAPPLPDLVPDPVYLEFMPPEDDVLPIEEHPLPVAVSPTADLPSYITESDPEEDPEEDDEDLEEDPTDYPDDRDDEEEEEYFGDNADNKEDDEDEDEEEEHLALDNSVPPPVCRTTAKIAAMIWLRAESPYTSHPLPLPSLIVLPHTRASMAMMRAAAPSTHILASRSETPPSGTPPLLCIPLPTPSTPLLLPSTDCKAGVFEVMLPPRKRLCITLGQRFKVGESLSALIARPTREFRRDYGFVATLDDEIRRDLKRDVGLSQRMIDFVMTVRQDTNEIYGRLDDAHDDRSLMSSQLNLLRRDRRAYASTSRLMESVAKISHEAWVQSMDASDTACYEERALRTTVLAQQIEIGDLQAADHRRPTQLTEALTLLRTLQTQMAVLQS